MLSKSSSVLKSSNLHYTFSVRKPKLASPSPSPKARHFRLVKINKVNISIVCRAAVRATYCIRNTPTKQPLPVTDRNLQRLILSGRLCATRKGISGDRENGAVASYSAPKTGFQFFLENRFQCEQKLYGPTGTCFLLQFIKTQE